MRHTHAQTHTHTHTHTTHLPNTALVDTLKLLRESALQPSTYDVSTYDVGPVDCLGGGGEEGGERRVSVRNLKAGQARQNTQNVREGKEGKQGGEGRVGEEGREGGIEMGTSRVLSDAYMSCSGEFYVCVCVCTLSLPTLILRAGRESVHFKCI